MNNHQNAIFHQITNFLKTPLALLGVDLKNFQFNKICHFANHPYLCKGLNDFKNGFFQNYLVSMLIFRISSTPSNNSRIEISKILAILIKCIKLYRLLFIPASIKEIKPTDSCPLPMLN